MANIDTATLALLDPLALDIVDQDRRTYETNSLTPPGNFINYSVDHDDILPGLIIADRALEQDTAGVNVRSHNKTYMWLSGVTQFGGTRRVTMLNAATGTCDFDLQNCNFVATNGAVNGFGQDGNVTDEVTGIISECNFVAIGATTWFINLGLMPLVEFSNNTLTRSVLNSTKAGTPIYGIEFDGTIRTQGGVGYTFRRNDSGGLAWCSHIGCTLSGTSYLNVDGTAPGEPSFLQYQSGEDNLIEYSINNRVEADNYSFQSQQGAKNFTVFNGYLWHPVWRDTNTATDVNDVRITWPAAVTPNDNILLPQTTVARDTIWTSPTQEADLNTSGYFIHTGDRGTTDRRRVLVVDKAVNLDGTLNTTYVYTPRAKSFTYQVDEVVTTILNEPDVINQDNGDAWTYPDTAAGRDLRTSLADIFVGTYTAATAPTEAADVDDVYPVGKKDWYEGGLNINFPISGNGTEITFTNNLTLADTTNVANDGNVDIAISGTTLSGTATMDTINGIDFSSTITTDTTLSNLNLNFDNVNLNNMTLGNNMTLDGGNYTNITLTLDGFTFVNNPTLVYGDGVTVDITNCTGDVTLSTTGASSYTQLNHNGTITTDGAWTEILPTITLTVSPVADVDGNAIFNGFFGVYDNVTDSVVQTPLIITAGNPVPTYDITNTNTHTVYVSRENTSGINGEGFVTGTFSTIRGSANEIQRFTPSQISPVLYEGDPNTVTSNVTEIDKAARTPGTPPNNPAVQVLFNGATAQQNGTITLAAFLQATNSIHYFSVMLKNNLMTDIISPGGIGSTIINSQYVTIGSEIAAQQLLQAITTANSTDWQPVTTAVVDTTTITIANNPSGISVGEVQVGVSNVFDTNQTIVDVKKGVGYTVKQLNDLSIVDDYVSGNETGDNL